MEAENSRLFIPFKILGDVRNANPGDKVVAQFTRWDPPARIPTCKILRVLGPGGEATTDHLGILAKFGLSSKFPKKVEDEAKAVASQITKEEIQGVTKSEFWEVGVARRIFVSQVMLTANL